MPLKPHILKTALSEKELNSIVTAYRGKKYAWRRDLIRTHLDLFTNLYFLYKKGMPEKKIKELAIQELGEHVIPEVSQIRCLFWTYQKLFKTRLENRGIKIL